MTFLRKLFGRLAAPGNGAPAAAVRQPVPAPIPEPQPPRGETAPAGEPEDGVTLPLKAITDLFPQELKGSLHKQPSEHVHIRIARELIRPQLAAGAVRITFGQLRAAAPEIFFHADRAPADAMVLLPLGLVIGQMMPGRREDQRQPEIPVAIPSIFNKAGPVRPSAGAASASGEKWYSQRRPTYERQPEPEPDPKPAAPPTVAQAPATPPNFLSLPVAAVLGALPEEIRVALTGTESFLIPLAEIESRMRTGRLRFPWGQLREWCGGMPGSHIAPEVEVELPLAAVTPLFMASRKGAEPRKCVEVDTRIPDLFSKAKIASRVHLAGNGADGTSRPARMPPSPPPAGPPVPPPQPAPQPPPQPQASSPAKIVERLRALDGVAGAFIATADGLLVAAEPEANGSLLAAFAPTTFVQLAKFSDMARLGQPESIDIRMGDQSTVHVRKAGKLFLGVLAQPGRTLPYPELTRISEALQPHAP